MHVLISPTPASVETYYWQLDLKVAQFIRFILVLGTMHDDLTIKEYGTTWKILISDTDEASLSEKGKSKPD